MGFVIITKQDGIATVALHRGKVNALNEATVEELHAAFTGMADESGIGAVVLTGRGKFFSFGFDIPEFLDYSRNDFTRYIGKFTDLYTDIFAFPKPVVAALNGHTIAGGCMLALACDYRIMVADRAKISLNEIGFGSTVFAGSVDMLRFWVGERAATRVLYSGDMYIGREALGLGLVDRLAAESELMIEAGRTAADMAARPAAAFRSIKGLLRNPVIERMRACEKKSIEEFVDIWYADETREKLRDIKIR